MVTEQHNQSSDQLQSSQTDRRLVLVVEDSPTQAMIIQEFLTRVGLHVLYATNGKMGVHLARSAHPALVLLDVQMPDMNGYEVCERLKKDPMTYGIPVIMFTRNDSLEAVQHGLESGAVDYIPKDAFAMAVLLETLRQMGLVNGSKHRFEFKDNDS